MCHKIKKSAKKKPKSFRKKPLRKRPYNEDIEDDLDEDDDDDYDLDDISKEDTDDIFECQKPDTKFILEIDNAKIDEYDHDYHGPKYRHFSSKRDLNAYMKDHFVDRDSDKTFKCYEVSNFTAIKVHTHRTVKLEVLKA